MIIVHAVWSSTRSLQIWGERPLDGDRLPRPRGRAPTSGRPRRHPYAAPAAQVRAAVAALTTLDAGDLRSGEVPVLLPSTTHGTYEAPTPSPDLPGAVGVSAQPDELRVWRVDALQLSAAQALDVLLAIPEESPPDARPAPSLQAAAVVATLALDLTARGRVVPGLVTREDGSEARWAPVLDAADRARMVAVARALPAALSAAPGGEGRSAGSVVRQLSEQLVDAAVRDALAQEGLRGTPGTGTSVEERWLDALTGADPVVTGNPADLQLLGKQLDAWQRSAAGGPLRTAFRLTPPSLEGDDEEMASGAAAVDDPAAPWELSFWLQAADDPSLQIPAAEVWRAGSTLSVLERTIEEPQERLLADLGRATRLYPELGEALDTARPEALELTTGGVMRFLRDAAPLLEQAGYGILLPSELRRPPRLGARLRTTSRSSSSDSGGSPSGLLGYEGVLDYRWEVAVEDQSLTEDELRELAELKSPLVRWRGRWVEVREDDLRAALRLLERGEAGQMTVAEAAHIGLGVHEPDLGLPVTGVDADGPLDLLLGDDVDQSLEPLPTPAGFAGQLRPYQERGVGWLAFLSSLGLGACLADDMGLGKTLQLLALLLAERQGPDGKTLTRRSKRWPAPTLLVCPMSIVGNWEREAARFTPDLRVFVHHGTDRLDGDAFAREVRRHDLVITTYALAARDHDSISSLRWGRLVLDEAQAIKNPSTRQSQAIRALDAMHRVALTGTPVENRLSELWSIMDFCNPGLMGSQRAFRNRFAVPIEKLHDDEAATRLRRVTQPFILRRVKTDRTVVADLPDKLEFDEHCNLTREQASLYQAVVDDMLAKIDTSEGIERKGLVLTTMLRLKQVCNHPAQLLADGSRLEGRSGKLARLEELLEEILAVGERALVFTQFAEWGGRLQAHLRARLGREVLFLHGGTSKAQRDHLVEAFQAGGPSVLLLSLKAGGVGLNLTAANHVLHYDRWWNPAVEDQATDRAFRIGQRRDVQVRRFVTVGTLEERIAEVIARKRDLAERVVGTGESWLTELSTEELREVIALGADAVAE